MRSVLLIGACFILVAAFSAPAQERSSERRVETTTTTTTTEVRRASALIGTRVSLESDTALGQVTDLVINDQGCIDYVIVRDEDEYVVIPWGVINYEVREHRVVVDVNISRERLREVTFRKDHWPNFYGGEFSRTVRTVWGDQALRREHQGDHRIEERRPDTRPGDRRDRGDRSTEERRPDTRPGDRRPNREPVNRTPGALPSDERPPDLAPGSRTAPDRRPVTRPEDRTPGVRPAEPSTNRPAERPSDHRPDRRGSGQRPSQGSEPTPPVRPGPGGS